ncbi:MAG: hypothetical protein ABSE58_09015 [Candidatus Limnocylindrales bacterium]|jgi:hypothetical protein
MTLGGNPPIPSAVPGRATNRSATPTQAKPKTIADTLALVDKTLAARKQRLGEVAATDETCKRLAAAHDALVKLAIARNDAGALALVPEREREALATAAAADAIAKARRGPQATPSIKRRSWGS